MANLKNITELPVAESADGLNLIVNDNGVAKQIAASAVGAQADWAETDETSPAFIKNKPVEEWDLDITVNVSANADDGSMVFNSIINSGTFDAVKSKLLNGEHVEIKSNMIHINDIGSQVYENCVICNAFYMPEGIFEGSPEIIGFLGQSVFVGYALGYTVFPDGTLEVSQR